MAKKKKRSRKKKTRPIPKNLNVAVESEGIRRFVAVLERDRINIVPVTFLYILFLGWLRTTLENFITGAESNFYIYAHFISFYFCMYLFGLLVVSVLSKEKPRKVANVLNMGFWLILLPPFVDYAISGGSVTGFYTYLPADQYLTALTTFGFGATDFIRFGILFEAAMIFLLAAGYIFIKTKAVIRSVVSAVVMYLFVLTISTPGLYFPFPFFPGEGWLKFPTSGLPSPDLVHLQSFAFLWYVFFGVILCLFLAYASHPGIFKALALSIRPLRTIHFAMLTVLGYLIARSTQGVEVNILTYPFYLDLAFLLVSVICVTSIWQFAIMINDIHDVEIDRASKAERPLVHGLMSEKHYLEVAATLGLIGFFSSVVLMGDHTYGYAFPLLALLFIGLGYIYSAPPVRFRNSAFHSVAIGLASGAVLVFGFLTPMTEFSGVGGAPVPVGYGMVEPTTEIWTFSIIIFFALSIAPMISDLKDYEADKEHKVRTIYTILGLERGKQLVSALIIFLFLLGLLVFQGPVDIAVFLILGILSVIGFYKVESYELVFMFYFAALIYGGARYLGAF